MNHRAKRISGDLDTASRVSRPADRIRGLVFSFPNGFRVDVSDIRALVEALDRAERDQDEMQNRLARLTVDLFAAQTRIAGIASAWPSEGSTPVQTAPEGHRRVDPATTRGQ